MTTSQQKLLPWLSNLVTKTIDQGLPVLPEVLFICRKQFRKSLFVSQGQVSQNHSPFSILFLLCCSLLCSAVLCYALLFSALLFCPLLFCSVLCSSLLCGFSGREMPFSGREIVFSGREKTMGMGISPVDAQQGCFFALFDGAASSAQVAADWFSRPPMRCCIHPDRQWFCPHLYAELRKKLTTNGQLREIFFGLYNLSRRGEHCSPTPRMILRCSGAHCAPPTR